MLSLILSAMAPFNSREHMVRSELIKLQTFVIVSFSLSFHVGGLKKCT